jgi:RNA polymerase sigma-70 factor (ECF subfamily)
MVQSQIGEKPYPTDAELVRCALEKDEFAVRTIIQKHNRRLYRVARSIVCDDGEAEDVLQEAYLHGFSALATFRGDSSLSTWLTRIVVNEALQRLRRRSERPVSPMDPPPDSGGQVIPFPVSATQSDDPEHTAARREICELVERAIDDLPMEFRTVLVARTIEGMSVEQTAELLGLRPETVKTRLHRARRMLKAGLAGQIGSLFGDVFPFGGKRCGRIADAVVLRLNRLS